MFDLKRNLEKKVMLQRRLLIFHIQAKQDLTLTNKVISFKNILKMRREIKLQVSCSLRSC